MVKKLKYKGKEYPYVFNYRAYRDATYKVGRDYGKDVGHTDFETLEAYLWHGLVEGARQMNVELDIEEEHIADMVNDIGIQVVVNAYVDFSQGILEKTKALNQDKEQNTKE